PARRGCQPSKSITKPQESRKAQEADAQAPAQGRSRGIHSIKATGKNERHGHAHDDQTEQRRSWLTVPKRDQQRQGQTDKQQPGSGSISIGRNMGSYATGPLGLQARPDASNRKRHLKQDDQT